MTTLETMDEAAITDLRKHVTGTVATPSDAEYPELVRPRNLATRPASRPRTVPPVGFEPTLGGF
jgi:hypothetical protein